jgi:hypothetical protein
MPGQIVSPQGEDRRRALGSITVPPVPITVPLFRIAYAIWKHNRAEIEHFGLRKPGFSSKSDGRITVPARK